MERTRTLVLSLTVGAVMGLAAIPAQAAASAGAPPVTAGARYLALGDSVTFGYMEANVVPAPDYRHPRSFIGYPELLAAELHLRVANAACPGETSASLIDASAQSNYCENSPGDPNVGYRKSFPLHVHYPGSQLAYGLHYLHQHRDVRLVSLMIGANDGLLCIETTPDACSSTSEMNSVKRKVTRSVRHILKAIRDQAHYRGQLAIVNYYSPFAAYNSRSVGLNQTVDAAAKPFHVVVADGYGEFARADRHSGNDPCTAGLLTQVGGGHCGIHPSYAGQSLLAQALEKVIRLG